MNIVEPLRRLGLVHSRSSGYAVDSSVLATWTSWLCGAWLLAGAIVLVTVLAWPKADPFCFTCEGDELRLTYGYFQLAHGSSLEASVLDPWWWSHKYGLLALHSLFGFDSVSDVSVLTRLLVGAACFGLLFACWRILPLSAPFTLIFILLLLTNPDIARFFRTGLLMKQFEFMAACGAVVLIAYSDHWRRGWWRWPVATLILFAIAARPNLVLMFVPVLFAIAVIGNERGSLLESRKDVGSLTKGVLSDYCFWFAIVCLLAAAAATKLIPLLTFYHDGKSAGSLPYLFNWSGLSGVKGTLIFASTRLGEYVWWVFVEGFSRGSQVLIGLCVTVGLLGVVAGVFLWRGRAGMLALALVGVLVAQLLASFADLYPFGGVRYGFHFWPLAVAGLGVAWAKLLSQLFKYRMNVLGDAHARTLVAATMVLITFASLTLAVISVMSPLAQLSGTSKRIAKLDRIAREVQQSVSNLPIGSPVIVSTHGLWSMSLFDFQDGVADRLGGILPPGSGFYRSRPNLIQTYMPDKRHAQNDIFYLTDFKEKINLKEFIRSHCRSKQQIAVFTRFGPTPVKEIIAELERGFVLVERRQSSFIYFSRWEPQNCAALKPTDS